jgi:hypothetical protein
MAKKPELPPKLIRWNLYTIASKAVWPGVVEAADEGAAMEIAAAEFKVAAFDFGWKLWRGGGRG